MIKRVLYRIIIQDTNKKQKIENTFLVVNFSPLRIAIFQFERLTDMIVFQKIRIQFFYCEFLLEIACTTVIMCYKFINLNLKADDQLSWSIKFIFCAKHRLFKNEKIFDMRILTDKIIKIYTGVLYIVNKNEV